jgi:hypothetical protein
MAYVFDAKRQKPPAQQPVHDDSAGSVYKTLQSTFSCENRNFLVLIYNREFLQRNQ